MQTVAYARFLKGEGARKFENNEDKKRSSLRFSPFFCPNLGENQKKKKKWSSPDSARFSTQIFCPNSKGGGGHDLILRTILRYLYITGTPKRGAMAQWPLPKYASVCESFVTTY